MNLTDWFTVIVGALVGRGLFSGIAHLVRQQKRPPVNLFEGASSLPGTPTRGDPSVSEFGKTWATILEVPDTASVKEIEDAYHAHIAECDRIRFAADCTADERKLAEDRRSRVSQAYEFIRPLRSP